MKEAGSAGADWSLRTTVQSFFRRYRFTCNVNELVIRENRDPHLNTQQSKLPDAGRTIVGL